MLSQLSPSSFSRAYFGLALAVYSVHDYLFSSWPLHSTDRSSNNASQSRYSTYYYYTPPTIVRPLAPTTTFDSVDLEETTMQVSVLLVTLMMMVLVVVLRLTTTIAPHGSSSHKRHDNFIYRASSLVEPSWGQLHRLKHASTRSIFFPSRGEPFPPFSPRSLSQVLLTQPTNRYSKRCPNIHVRRNITPLFPVNGGHLRHFVSYSGFKSCSRLVCVGNGCTETLLTGSGYRKIGTCIIDTRWYHHTT